jgi:hypothetical protein
MDRRHFLGLIAVAAVVPSVPMPRRVAVLKHSEGRVSIKACSDQNAALEWIRERWKRGDEIEIHWEGGGLY